MKETEKISLARCKAGLESDGSRYTEQEVLAIRDFLYQLAEWDYTIYQRLKAREEAIRQEEIEKENQSRNNGLEHAA